MITNLQPYPEYKESEQGWLGRVPQHWPVLPNRALFAEVKDREHPDEEMLSVTITRGIIRQKALLTDSSKKDSSRQDKSAYKLVQPRDIAYNKMRAWQGAIGVSDLRGIISPAYIVMRLREEQNARYFHHLYRTPRFAKEAEWKNINAFLGRLSRIDATLRGSAFLGLLDLYEFHDGDMMESFGDNSWRRVSILSALSAFLVAQRPVPCVSD